MKQFLWSLPFLFFSQLLIADSAKCILYKARFELQNGKIVEGYINYFGFDSLIFHFTDESFKSFMEKQFAETGDTMNLYLRIQVLKYPEVPTSGDEHFHFLAVVESDNFKLAKNDVKSYHFIDYSMEEPSTLPREKWNFDCKGDRIITGLTQKEIDWLRQKPVAQISWYSQVDLLGYWLMSYNSDVEENGLRGLCDRLKLLDEKIGNCKPMYVCFEREYAQIKKEFSALNIIMFHFATPD